MRFTCCFILSAILTPAILTLLGCQGQTSSSDPADSSINDSARVEQAAGPVDPESLAPREITPDKDRTLHARLVKVLPKHLKTVEGVAYSADGKWIATIGADLRVNISDGATGRLKHKIQIASHTLYDEYLDAAIAFSPQGALLAAAVDSKVKIIDASSGRVIRTLANKKNDTFEQLEFTPQGDLLVALGTWEILTWSMPDGVPQTRFELFSSTLDRIAITPDGRQLVTPDRGNSIGIYDLRSGKLVDSIEGTPERHIFAVALTPDGSTLLAIGRGVRLLVYDFKTRVIKYHVDKMRSVPSLFFSPQGLLASKLYSKAGFFLVGEQGLHPVGHYTLRGDQAARLMAFSPVSPHMVAAGKYDQDEPELFELQWSREERTLAKFATFQDDFVVSPDGRYLAWRDNRAWNLFSMAEGKIVKTFRFDEESQARGAQIDFSAQGEHFLLHVDGKEYEGEADRLDLYTLPDMKLEHSFTLPEEKASAQFTPDGRSIVFWNWGGSQLYRLESRQMSEKRPLPAGGRGRFFGGDNESYISAKEDELRVYDWASANLRKAWRAGHDIDGFDLSPNARLVATWSDSRSRIYIWDLLQGELLTEIDADDKYVLTAAFSPDGKWLLSSGEDQLLKIWSCENWQLRAVCPSHDGRTEAIVFLSESPQFITWGDHERYDVGRAIGFTSVKQWDLRRVLAECSPPPLVPKRTYAPPTVGIPNVSFDNAASDSLGGFADQGKAVYFSSFPWGDLRVFDLAAQRFRSSIPIGKANWVEFSPDGQWFAVSHDHGRNRSGVRKPGTVQIWNAKTQALHKEITLDTPGANGTCFSPDSRVLAVTSSDALFGAKDSKGGELTLWDVATGERIRNIWYEDAELEHVTFSPDGKRVAFGTRRGEVVKVWNLDKNKLDYQCESGYHVKDMAFSPDGKWLALGKGWPSDGDLQLYHATTGRSSSLLKDFREVVESVAFAPDSSMLAALCTDQQGQGGYRFWSLPDGRPIRRVILEPGVSTKGMIGFSPDGSTLLTDTLAGLDLWNIEHLIDIAYQHQLEQLKKRNHHLDYKGTALRIGLASNSNNRELQLLPPLKRPFLLDLRKSEAVTDEGLAHLVRQDQLVGLELQGTTAITANGLRQFIGLPIQTLNCSDSAIDPRELLKLVGDFDQLLTLSVGPLFRDSNDAEDRPNLSQLAKLTRLRELSFKRCEVAGSELAHLAELTDLETLEIPLSYVVDDDLKHLARLKNLRTLDLSGSDITGAGLAHLSAHESLETLRLANCSRLTREGVAALRRFKHLRHLDLRNTPVDDDGLAAIAGLVELEQIELPERMTGKGMVHLAKLVRLKRLDFHRKQIDDEDLLHLADLHLLESVSFLDATGFTGSGLAGLAEATRLHSLYLSSVESITDAGLSGVAKLTELRKLSLPPTIGDAGLAALTPLQKLQKLSLEKATGVTGEGLAHLSAFPRLVELDLDEIELTDAVIPHLKSLKQLHSISIRGSQITPAGVEELKRNEQWIIQVNGP